MRTPVIVFDVNETLSDMAPMADRFADVGAPPHLASFWFAALLRDAFALTAAGGGERFATIAADGVRSVLHGVECNRSLEEAVRHVLNGFQGLPVRPDVPDGVRALRAGGHRLATLSNGGTAVAEGLLSRAGLRDEFERVLSVEQAEHVEARARLVRLRRPGVRCRAGADVAGRRPPVGRRRRDPRRARRLLAEPHRRAVPVVLP